MVSYEQMFGTAEATIDHTLERARLACRARLEELRDLSARIDQEVTELVREADDRGDWQAAGCSSSARGSRRS